MTTDRGPNLVAWQWSIYSDSHRDGLNLAVHIVAVPLFWLGTAMLIYSLATVSPIRVAGALLLLVLSLLMQINGHKREKFGVKLAGFGDFSRRILTEQFVTFPRFVVTGGWWKNLTS